MALTFWDNEAAARANEENRYYQEQLVKFLQYFSGPPIREGFTVNVHAMKPPGASTRGGRPSGKDASNRLLPGSKGRQDRRKN